MPSEFQVLTHQVNS